MKLIVLYRNHRIQLHGTIIASDNGVDGRKIFKKAGEEDMMTTTGRWPYYTTMELFNLAYLNGLRPLILELE